MTVTAAPEKQGSWREKRKENQREKRREKRRVETSPQCLGRMGRPNFTDEALPEWLVEQNRVRVAQMAPRA